MLSKIAAKVYKNLALISLIASFLCSGAEAFGVCLKIRVLVAHLK